MFSDLVGRGNGGGDLWGMGGELYSRADGVL